jgi:hypothetical protein
MGVDSRTYWFVCCDTDGCCASTPDDQDDPFHAEEHARAWGWVETPLGPDGPSLWKCPEHAGPK